ncbi:M28 family metallopeptidase [Microbulbifer aggregans]|uniref:M28 family metallopeptidase n=1 Tax=Microbulbifer aggregans TaxID=1769779 RepID=UPI001CFE43B4|nr:M28 family metallopeptidase [Microbulbifer aggregans]
MKITSLIGGGLVTAALAACSASQLFFPLPSADSDNIQEHLEYLASDALAGRKTGSAGYRLAADYVAEQFAALGLESISGADYLQPVSFREASWGERPATFELRGRDGDITFELGKDFIAAPPTTSEQAAVSAGLVFVGYGIDAPAYRLDDYAGLDVKGKIVVALQGRPARLPSEVGAHYASGRTKRSTAARHGAIGFIALNTPESEARRPFARSAAHLQDPRFDWLRADNTSGNAIPGMRMSARLDMPAAKQLFVGAPRSLDTVFLEMRNGVTPKGFPLPYSASLTSSARHQTIISPNVVGLLPGSDPKLKDEYVVFSAHLDHIGREKGKDGDRINNGAQDNAAGIAVMLEVARLFKASGRAPRRSILFVAVTAEEEGLLGSDYFAQHPPVPPRSIVANINLDMPMLLYPFRDVIAFGAEHSSLGKTAAHAADRVGLKLSPDPMPEQVIFVRSDHYSFVRQGIPAIYLITGREALDRDIDGTAAQVEFLKSRYHRPGDEADSQVNYVAARQFAEVNYAIAREVTDGDKKPRWNRGDFFGELYARPR